MATSDPQQQRSGSDFPIELGCHLIDKVMMPPEKKSEPVMELLH